MNITWKSGTTRPTTGKMFLIAVPVLFPFEVVPAVISGVIPDVIPVWFSDGKFHDDDETYSSVIAWAEVDDVLESWKDLAPVDVPEIPDVPAEFISEWESNQEPSSFNVFPFFS